MQVMYTYKARCVRVVDGDTADLDIDLGFYLTARHRIRVLGIDTPELHDKDLNVRARAVLARGALEGLLTTPGEIGFPLTIKTEKSDSFGRWLASIQVGGVDVATHLLSLNLAVPFER
jgi:micrococcal nuclease